jgi:phosphohistidine phosphatase
MKELFLIRHGKSSWKEAAVHDKDRPLRVKGVEDVYELATTFKESNIYPELIISSSATRSWQTARIIATDSSYPVERILVKDQLYACGKQELFDEVCRIPNDIQIVMLVGHDPSLTNFANTFLKHPIEKIKTSGFIHLKFDGGKWSEITNSPSQLARKHLTKR